MHAKTYVACFVVYITVCHAVCQRRRRRRRRDRRRCRRRRMSADADLGLGVSIAAVVAPAVAPAVAPRAAAVAPAVAPERHAIKNTKALIKRLGWPEDLHDVEVRSVCAKVPRHLLAALRIITCYKELHLTVSQSKVLL